VVHLIILIFALSIFLFSPFHALASINIPGTPPFLNLVIENIEIKTPGFLLTEEGGAGFGGCPCYHIERSHTSNATPGYYGVLRVEKKSDRRIRVGRDNEFYIKVGRKLEYYPSISLKTNSNDLAICRDGDPPDFSSICKQTIEDFRSLGDLEIRPSKEFVSSLYNHYVKTHTVLYTQDWKVNGEAFGNKEDTSRVLLEFTITGNFEYTPPSDDWIKFSEEYGRKSQEESERSKRSILISRGLLIVFVGFLSWIILKKRERSLVKRLIFLALLFVVAYFLFNFFVHLFSPIAY
jgi:hypothetical protein